jgi:hypothetical protein
MRGLARYATIPAILLFALVLLQPCCFDSSDSRLGHLEKARKNIMPILTTGMNIKRARAPEKPALPKILQKGKTMQRPVMIEHVTNGTNMIRSSRAPGIAETVSIIFPLIDSNLPDHDLFKPRLRRLKMPSI